MARVGEANPKLRGSCHTAAKAAQAAAVRDGVCKDSAGALPDKALLGRLRRRLLRFFGAQGRPLPWRRSRDPYAIWVSEIMCQQTQVDTVVPRYALFLQQFPNVYQLAAASTHEVCAAWAGLGYYRRARFLHQAARQVVQQHDGVLPGTVAGLLALPGIGRYTAGAIASIAFGVPTALVDGNVERLLSRLFALPAEPRSPAGARHLWSLATALVCQTAPGALNQALMEMGALVCTPKAPKCVVCPLRRECQAFAAQEPERYPTKRIKAPRQALAVTFAYARDELGTWLERRPLDGLWAGLWELPSATGKTARLDLESRLGSRLGKALGGVSHTLTHRDVSASLFAVAGSHFVAREDFRPFLKPLEAPISTLARKALLQAAAADAL